MADQDKTKQENNSDSSEQKDKKLTFDEDEDTSFGLGPWRTKSLKDSHHLVIFAVLTGLMGLCSGVVRASLIGQFTSFEKHYHFETLSVSQTLFANESFGVLMIVFATGYIANYMSIPKITGLSGIFYGIGMAAPAFLNYYEGYESQGPVFSKPLPTPPAVLPPNITLPPPPSAFPNYMTCNLNPNATIILPPTPEEGKSMYKMIYTSSMLCYGLLSAVRWGPMPYLFFDNNTAKKSRVGIYLAISIVISELSRPFGYLFNNYVDELHVTLEDVPMDPKNPQFVTAWWLGPIVFGFLTVAVSIPMLFLPAHLMSGARQSQHLKHASVRAVHKDMKINTHPDDHDRAVMARGHGMSTMQKLKAYMSGVPRIIKNPLFLTLFVIWGIVVIPAVGLSLANLQYTMFEYNIQKNEAIKGDALTNFAANGLASIVSAIVCSKISRKRHYLEFIMGCVFFSFVFLPISFFLGCDDVNIYGLNDSPKYGANLTQHAVACPCDMAPTLPVCGSDGKNYLSPCHAGCTMASAQGVFVGCKNVDVGNLAIPALCPEDCHDKFVSFSILYTVTTFLYKMTEIPKILLALRLILPKDRGVAFASLGIANVISSFLGPLILLKFFNDQCLVNLTEKICMYFDRHNIRMLKTGVEFHTYMFAFVMWFVLSKLNHLADKKIKDKAHGAANGSGDTTVTSRF